MFLLEKAHTHTEGGKCAQGAQGGTSGTSGTSLTFATFVTLDETNARWKMRYGVEKEER